MEKAFGILFSLQRGTARHEQWVVQCLDGSWNRLVGEKLAAVCRPACLKNSELKVEIIDDAWIDTVRSMRLELQERIRQATCGEVTSLRVSPQQSKPPRREGDAPLLRQGYCE